MNSPVAEAHFEGIEQFGVIMKELIECMAKALVDDPDQVAVNIVKGEHVTIVELKVPANDLGKVIGKSGRTAEAMRTILGAASARHGVRCKLEITELAVEQ